MDLNNQNQNNTSSMVSVEIPLELKVIRKLKAYQVLSGMEAKDIVAEISGQVSDVIEKHLQSKIAEVLGIEQPTIAQRVSNHVTELARFGQVQPNAAVNNMLRDVNGFQHETDGAHGSLGDDDWETSNEPEELLPEGTIINTAGGITDEDLENDLEVSNPETEAKAVAPAEDTSFEKLFEGKRVKVTPINIAPARQVDPRIAKRNHLKNAPKRKAIISSVNEL